MAPLWPAGATTIRSGSGTSPPARRSGRIQGVPVGCLAFNPGGTILASASSATGSIRIWDVANGYQLRDFAGHQNGINSLAFSPDGATLATAGDDEMLKLWSGEVTPFEIAGYLAHHWCQLDGSTIEWKTGSDAGVPPDSLPSFLNISSASHLGLLRNGKSVEEQHFALFSNYLRAGNWNSASMMASLLENPILAETAEKMTFRARVEKAQSSFDAGQFKHAQWHINQITPLVGIDESDPTMLAASSCRDIAIQNRSLGESLDLPSSSHFRQKWPSISIAISVK